MAYVKLPEELRSWEVVLADGRASRFEFSVFAGETVRTESRGSTEAASLHIRSQRGTRRFDFSKLPVKFEPGDVAGVLAVLPQDEDEGPILCVANLDTDSRVDFLNREPELLRLMTEEPLDFRQAGISGGELTGDLVRGAVFGLVAAVITAGVTSGLAVGADAQAGFGSFITGTLQALVSGGAPLYAGLAVGFLAVAGLVGRSALRLGRQARFQRDLLRHVWTRAGEALGFVQDHIDAFRFSSTIVAKTGPTSASADEEFSDDQNSGTPPPQLARSFSIAREVEEARTLPLEPCSTPPTTQPALTEELVPVLDRTARASTPPKRLPPRLPSSWRRTQASEEAAQRRGVTPRTKAAEGVNHDQTTKSDVGARRAAKKRARAATKEAAKRAAEKRITAPRVLTAPPAAQRSGPEEQHTPASPSPAPEISVSAAKTPETPRGAKADAPKPRRTEAPTQVLAAARARLDVADFAEDTAQQRFSRLAHGLRGSALKGGETETSPHERS